MYWRLFLLRYNEQLLLISSHPLNVPESHVISSIQLEWLFACFTVAQSDRAPPSEDVFLISRRSQLSAAEIRSQSASPLTSHSSLWSTWWCWSASWALARPLFSNCSHCIRCSISHIPTSTYSFLFLLQFFVTAVKDDQSWESLAASSIIWVYMCSLSFTRCLPTLMKSLEINTSLKTLSLHLREEDTNQYHTKVPPCHHDTSVTAIF